MAPSGLVVCDLDGTLLRGSTVCEVLAARLGRLEEMRSFEALTQEHEIARARAELVRWYNIVSRRELVSFLQAAQLAPGAHEGIAQLQRAGVEVAIASITWKFAVDWFAAQLGVTRTLGTGLGEDGAIQHIWPRHKADWLRDLASRLTVPYERTAAVGDSPGDFAMLGAAGLRFFVGVEPPRDMTCVHIPRANVLDVAECILARWQLG